MRPLRLTMTAFGPYAEKTVINFEDLSDRNLFLICGPTGAGKTTVLDAMCYALYGRTTGDRSGKSMRSGFASPTTLTEVIFDFALGNKVYRACRMPEQEVAKVRGSGTTVKGSQSSLCELEDGKEINTIRTGIEEEATKLIGLNANQFCQVILLPQGDFRKLLVAKAEEREGILKQLFKTKRFSDFQDILKQKRFKLSQELESKKAEIAGLLVPYGVENKEELEKKKEESQILLSSKEKGNKELEEKLSAFQKEMDEKSKLEVHFISLEKSEKEIVFFNQKKEEMAKKEVLLSLIRSALELAPYFIHLKEKEEAGKAITANLKLVQKTILESEEEEKRRLLKEEKLNSEKGFVEKARNELPILKGLVPKVQELKDAEELYEKAEKEVEKAEKKLISLQKAEETALTLRNEKEKISEEIEKAYIFGQAAILAAKLKEGEPCPVCGSVHHPSPRSAEGDLPSEEEYKNAKKQAEVARSSYEKAQKERDTYQQETYSEIHKIAAQRLAKVESFKDIPDDLRDPRLLFKKISSLETKISTWEREEKRNQEEKERLTTTLAKERGREKDLTAQREEAAAKYVEENNKLLAKLKEKGFENKNRCLEILQEAENEEMLRKEIEEYKENRSAAEKRIAEEKEYLLGKERPQMDVLNKIWNEKMELHKKGVEEVSKIKTLIHEMERILKELSSRTEEKEKTEKSLSVVQGLYQLVRGSDKSKISLERFVLGALLDEVAKAANLRLKEMSKKRYTLRRIAGDQSAQKEGKGGLSLEVSDAFTGRTRPANTLSGGETFLASLSLALGLADVVQAKQGGVKIDTMFIDEGFGTLDPDALNSAMNTLVDLQNTGRLVGIISHVPELEERIDAKLKVEPNEKGNGSKAMFEIG